ncbi:MAG: type III-A CRISPR-associated RAMP protein Csm4 [Oscillospiraceae bacterium]|nr:type III-A CRISPR-associated RAMP protein Csm4 [Oscillospiraceae bacterium]
MNYCLYKLSFDAPVHLGASDSALSLDTAKDSFCADTLFSALCHSALSLGGPERLDQLCRWAQDGTVLLSDGFPWKGERYYLPKPCVSGEYTQEVSTQARKAMKALAWVPVGAFQEFSASLRGEGVFDALRHRAQFGVQMEREQVSASRAGEDPRPYYVGAYLFQEDAGLYFLAGFTTPQQQSELTALLTGLGYTGIGGKVSAGCGRFHIAQQCLLSADSTGEALWLYRGLTDQTARRCLLLTTSLPEEAELDAVMEQASCQVVRRGGFVQSAQRAGAPQKKRTQYFLAAGAVLTRRFSGALYQVGPEGGHPVFRYARPIFLGVNL